MHLIFMAMFLISCKGLCTMVSVSWYAANITQEFFNPLYPGQKWVSMPPPAVFFDTALDSHPGRTVYKLFVY